MKQRLESLDALRGFDLFCLVALSDLVEELAEVVDKPWMGSLMQHFTHKTWEGFSAWDLVMPLFMFMAGVATPFALSGYQEQGTGLRRQPRHQFPQHKQVALLRAGAICRRLLRLPHPTEQLHYPLHYPLSIV